MSHRQVWTAATPEELDIFRGVIKRVAERVLPAPGTPWDTRRQEALNETPALDDFTLGGPLDDVRPGLDLEPGPFAVAREVAAAQGCVWPDDADTLVYAVLNRGTLPKGFYDVLTGPWRALIGPLHRGDDDPDLTDAARDAARALLLAGGDDPLSVDDLLTSAIGIAPPAQT